MITCLVKSLCKTKLYVLLIGLVLILGCTTQNSGTFLPTQTVLPLDSPVEPDKTNTPMPSSISTLFGPTFQATLSLEKRETEIQNLLKPNESCKLPCWWGFTPGNVAWVEVEQFLGYMNAPAFEYSSNQTVFYATQLGYPDISYSLSIEFLVKRDTVEGIIIRSLNNFDTKKFQEIWMHYQPSLLLQDYGPPSRMWLETAGVENNNLIGALLYLFYDQQGFLISYQIVGKASQDSYQFCPEIGSEINLFLQSPSNPAPVDILAGQIDRQYIDTIEQATGTTIEEIHKHIFETGCFETTKSLGP